MAHVIISKNIYKEVLKKKKKITLLYYYWNIIRFVLYTIANTIDIFQIKFIFNIYILNKILKILKSIISWRNNRCYILD